MKASMKFHVWLKCQENREDPIGDLARDVERTGFRSVNVAAYKAHLEYNGACFGAHDALRCAKKEWSAYKRGELLISYPELYVLDDRERWAKMLKRLFNRAELPSCSE